MFTSLTNSVTKGVKSLGLSDSSNESKRKEKTAGMSEDDAECYLNWGLTIEEEDILVGQLIDEVLYEVEELNGSIWDHETFRRFLRARKHNIAHAKAMVLKTIEWRKTNNIDTILEDFDFHEKEEFQKHYPEGFYCTDKEGRPVYIQKPGDIDCTELWKFTTLERSIQYHITQQERYIKIIAPSASLKAGRKAFQSVVIIDMEGVGVSTLTGEVRTIMAKVMSIDQDYYPELMHKALIINAPTSFRIIWSLVKHLLDTRTQDKIEVLPSNYAPHLLQHIAPENLMECYGGTNKAPLSSSPGLWNDEEVKKALREREEKNAEGLTRFFSARSEMPSSTERQKKNTSQQ